MRVVKFFLALSCLLALGMLACFAGIYAQGQPRIYASLENFPSHEVGIVLTCAPTSADHYNPFFLLRGNAAAALYHSHRIKKIYVSGNGWIQETQAMRDLLVKRGVKPEDIIEDPASLRTYDSIVRLHRLWGVDQAVLISQRLHVQRALFLAKHLGMNAVGFAAGDPPLLYRRQAWIYEFLARPLAIRDIYLKHPRPAYMDQNVPILNSRVPELTLFNFFEPSIAKG